MARRARHHGRLILVGGDEFGSIGGVPGSDSHLLVPELARAAVVSVGVEPDGVPIRRRARRGRSGAAPGAARHPARAPQGPAGARRSTTIPPGSSPCPEAARRCERAAEAIGTLANGWAGLRGDPRGGRSRHDAVVRRERHLHGRTRAEPAAGPGLDRADGDRELIATSGCSTCAPACSCGPPAMRRAADPAVRLGGRPVASGACEPRGRAHLELRRHVRGADRRHRDGARGSRAGPSRPDRPIRQAAGSQSPPGTGSTMTDGRRVVERLAAWVADGRGRPTGRAPPTLLAEVEQLGFDRLLAEHRDDVGASVGRRRGPHRGRAPRTSWRRASPPSTCSERRRTRARRRSAPGASPGRRMAGTCSGMPTCSSCPRSPPSGPPRPGPCSSTGYVGCRRLGPQLPPRVWAAPDSRGSPPGDGTDVTPRSVRGRHGELIPIRTGEHEEHVVAAVAWAACEYAAWTGDAAFLQGAGGDLIVETARYWASRAAGRPRRTRPTSTA